MSPAKDAQVPQLVTTKWVAELFSVTVETVRVWIDLGYIKGRKVNGYWRVDRQSAIDYANGRYGS